MQKMKKRVLSIIMVLCTIAGLLAPAAPVLTARAAEQLSELSPVELWACVPCKESRADAA